MSFLGRVPQRKKYVYADYLSTANSVRNTVLEQVAKPYWPSLPDSAHVENTRVERARD